MCHVDLVDAVIQRADLGSGSSAMPVSHEYEEYNEVKCSSSNQASDPQSNAGTMQPCCSTTIQLGPQFLIENAVLH